MPIAFDTVKSDANAPLAVVQVGQRGKLDTEHAAAAAKCMLHTRETFPSAVIVLSVAGYEADKRELWDVPEVVDYILELFDNVFLEWPSGSLNDLNLDDSSAALILCCVFALRVIGRDPNTGSYLFAPGRRDIVRAGQPDLALAKELEELRRQFEADSEFPDVIAAWKAIRCLTRFGPSSCPFPAWVDSYLAAAAKRIDWLWLGIHPDEDRLPPLSDIGKLRKVPHGQKDGTSELRYHDARKDHVAAALGFVHKGWNAFRQHDRSTSDAQYLSMYDDPSLEDNKQLRREVRRTIINVMMTNENISEPAARNRLSKARHGRSGKTS